MNTDAIALLFIFPVYGILNIIKKDDPGLRILTSIFLILLSILHYLKTR